MQLPQTHVGAVGTGLTISASLVTRAVEFTPVLQAASLLVSILAGLATVGWYVYKFINRK